MRRPIGKPARANSGDTVRISCRVAKGSDQSRIGVWSKNEGFEFSPHIQLERMDFMVEGRSSMIQPMYVRLFDERPRATFDFVADDDLIFQVIQEIDVEEETSAKVRIRVYRGYSLRLLRMWLRVKKWFTKIKGTTHGKVATQK